jgi:hypothetical protein
MGSSFRWSDSRVLMIYRLGLAVAWLLVASAAPAPVALDLILGDTMPPRLSDFRLFTDARGTDPNDGVEPYDLNTPLFSDYAEKFRYLYLPPGTRARPDGEGLPDFPLGTVLVKSFGYPADMRRPERDIRILETRLLIRRATGWVALPYVWNAELGDAELKRGGKRLPVDWIDARGRSRSISYAVPNQNQCKECHALSGEITPIGPKARNMRGGPGATLPVWDDPATGSLDRRARAYLDVNCGHCHNPKGAASNSGLFLTWEEKDRTAIGIGKRPVAAGRGSGGLDFDIAPGHPERSILTFRMKTTEPGLAMPELGRATVHDEAVVLLEDWIRAMN